MVRSIIILNILVFVLWYVYPNPEFMAQNFLVSWSGLAAGRFWTLLTSVFSHNSAFHILINLYVFSGFGGFLEAFLGARRFLTLYLAAGIGGSLLHCLVSATLLAEPALPALGASGAICGIILYFSLAFPAEKVLILGVIPVPAIWGAILLAGLDVWGLVSQAQGSGLPIGHGAHLGGAFTGLIFFLLRRREPIV